MNKKKTWITLTILVVLGSFFNFYFTNMVMSGISNKDSSNFLIKLIAGFPGLFFNIIVIAAIFFIYRWYLNPKQTKKYLFVYGIEEAIFGLLGLSFTILSGVLTYGSFIKPYPFAGFHILMTIFFVAVIAIGVLAAFFIRKRVEGKEVITQKLTVKRGFLTAGLSLIYYFALNRFGAFLYSPIYIQWRTFDQTFVFYLSLLIPLGVIIHAFLYVFKVYDKSKKSSLVGMCISCLAVVLSIALNITTIAIGTKNPAFISAISPAMPIERLMTLPIDILLIFLSSLLLSGIATYKSIRHYLKKK